MWKGRSGLRYRNASGAVSSLHRLAVLCIPLTHATAWAQAGLAIPALGTTHADYFFGDIPCTRGLSEAEVQGDAGEGNTGKVITETLGDGEPMHTPGVVVYQHGPFAWGKDAHRRGTQCGGDGRSGENGVDRARD